MATMAWAVVMVAMAVVMDVATVAQAVVMAGALAYMDMVAVVHLAVEDTSHMGSTENFQRNSTNWFTLAS